MAHTPSFFPCFQYEDNILDGVELEHRIHIITVQATRTTYLQHKNFHSQWRDIDRYSIDPPKFPSVQAWEQNSTVIRQARQAHAVHYADIPADSFFLGPSPSNVAGFQILILIELAGDDGLYLDQLMQMWRPREIWGENGREIKMPFPYDLAREGWLPLEPEVIMPTVDRLVNLGYIRVAGCADVEESYLKIADRFKHMVTALVEQRKDAGWTALNLLCHSINATPGRPIFTKMGKHYSKPIVRLLSRTSGLGASIRGAPAAALNIVIGILYSSYFQAPEWRETALRRCVQIFGRMDRIRYVWSHGGSLARYVRECVTQAQLRVDLQARNMQLLETYNVPDISENNIRNSVLVGSAVRFKAELMMMKGEHPDRVLRVLKSWVPWSQRMNQAGPSMMECIEVGNLFNLEAVLFRRLGKPELALSLLDYVLVLSPNLFNLEGQAVVDNLVGALLEADFEGEAEDLARSVSALWFNHSQRHTSISEVPLFGLSQCEATVMSVIATEAGLIYKRTYDYLRPENRRADAAYGAKRRLETYFHSRDPGGEFRVRRDMAMDRIRNLVCLAQIAQMARHLPGAIDYWNLAHGLASGLRTHTGSSLISEFAIASIELSISIAFDGHDQALEAASWRQKYTERPISARVTCPSQPPITLNPMWIKCVQGIEMWQKQPVRRQSMQPPSLYGS